MRRVAAQPLHNSGARTPRLTLRRGAVLPATLMVLVLAALAAMGALALADAERESVSAALERGQIRAMAWSGVQAAMAELAAQRGGILGGEEPVLTETWELFQRPSGARGVVRLLAVGADGALAASESAKIDINSAPVEVLAKVPGLGEAGAAAVVAAREERAFSSVEELVGIGGLTGAEVHGAGRDASSGTMAGEGAIPLVQLLTAWAFDPNIQAGLGARGLGHEGELRVNINAPWSEGMERAIARRFDAETAAGVRSIMEQGRTFESDGAIIEVLRFFQIEPGDWVEALDAFTTCGDPFVAGRVDINRAPKEVIACLPGFDEETASAVVDARERLDAETLRSVAWPAIEGVLTPEQSQEAVGHVTVRSAQWRVRVEVGYEDTAASRQGETGDDEAPLRGRMVLEAVIDIAAERPRVAYLRDVTFLDLGLALVPEVEESGEEDRGEVGSGAAAAEGEEEEEVAEAGEAEAGAMPDAGMTGEGAGSGKERDMEEAVPPGEESSNPAAGPPPPSESAPEKQSPAGVAPAAPAEDNRRGRWTPRTAQESRATKTGQETSPTKAAPKSRPTGARP